MLDESICHFRGVGSILCFNYFLYKNLLANSLYPDRTPHCIASDLDLHCLPMTLLRVSRYEWVKMHGFCTSMQIILNRFFSYITYKLVITTDYKQ